MSLIYAAVIDIRRTLCLSPGGEQENEAFYSGTPERGVPGEGWSRQKIATLRGGGVGGLLIWKVEMFTNQQRREREGGKRETNDVTPIRRPLGVLAPGAVLPTCASLC